MNERPFSPEEYKLIKKIEPKISENGKNYWEIPKLKKNEYLAVALKKGGFIRPTKGKPYMSKDKFFYMNFDVKIHDLYIVDLKENKELLCQK